MHISSALTVEGEERLRTWSRRNLHGPVTVASRRDRPSDRGIGRAHSYRVVLDYTTTFHQ